MEATLVEQVESMMHVSHSQATTVLASPLAGPAGLTHPWVAAHAVGARRAGLALAHGEQWAVSVLLQAESGAHLVVQLRADLAEGVGAGAGGGGGTCRGSV